AGGLVRRVFLPWLGALALVSAACALAQGVAAAAPPADSARDLETVRQRLAEELFSPASSRRNSDKDANSLLAALWADGRWPDIDYADQSRSNWKPGAHLSRVFRLVQAYRTKANPLSGKPEVRVKILLALRWWLISDLQCPNWWWNDIGTPETLGRTLILLGDEFPADLMPAASKILKRAERQDMTGQNTLWVCSVRISRGCIEKQPELVAAAFKRIADEIKVSTGEGIQPDFSFYQHGPQLYSGGYGRGFAGYGPQLARLASGTAWAFPAEKTGILTSYLLDGEQWMIRGDRFDPSVTGREITRGGSSAGSMAKACEDMLALGAPRRAEFEAFARRVRGEKDAAALVGNRHFWRSDFMVHQRPEWYASVRMFSNRLYNSELVNGEGKKSHHLADGVTLLRRTGREFDAMPPVWDWNRLPGTTCEQAPLSERTVKQKGETSFVGGASDGLCGVAAMDLKRGPLAAKKAWFFFEDGMVALGAGITCTSDNKVFTSIDQRPLAGEVRGSSAKPFARGEQTLDRPQWVLHDGMGYVLGDRDKIHLKADAQEGSWRDISDPASPAKVVADVFSLWIDHGAKPSGAVYAYAVLPRATKEQTAGYAAKMPEEVLGNTPDLQAAGSKAGGVTGVVFWKAGKLGDGKTVVLAADQPCVVLMRAQAAGVRLAVANPEQKALVVVLEVGQALEGEGCTWSAETKCTKVEFDLPGGAEAGKSVVRELKRRKL
ncbi:MAG: polysaccharide lyase 8 family protein, partial [Planctomycetota bacterium]|nr:polysaccharide lyase 8 family protein [Planctomycetota bacterium]